MRRKGSFFYKITLLTLFVIFSYGCGASLHNAILKGDLESAGNLIAQNKDINKKNKWGETPLMLAARMGQDDIVKALIHAGADVNAVSKAWSTPIMYAAAQGHTGIVKILLAGGADIAARDNNGWTAMLLSSRYGHAGTMELLLEEGADINRALSGWTPLMYTVRYGFEEMARFLIEKDADINAKSTDKWTALMLAARYGYPQQVELLLAEGADINDRTEAGWTAFLLASYSDHETTQDITRILIEKGSEPYILDGNADQLYATAKSFYYTAEYAQNSGNVEKAIENYTTAAEYFQKAIPSLKEASGLYGKKLAGIVLISTLKLVGIGADIKSLSKGRITHYSDLVPEPPRMTSRDEQFKQRYDEKLERSEEYDKKCREAIEHLQEAAE